VKGTRSEHQNVVDANDSWTERQVNRAFCARRCVRVMPLLEIERTAFGILPATRTLVSSILYRRVLLEAVLQIQHSLLTQLDTFASSWGATKTARTGCA
jgi:hypothetical protein